MEYYIAFLIGLFGSLHCIGMCGPIALALPQNFETKISYLTSRVSYNFGRILTYVFIGAIFGLFGSQLMFAGFQQYLSIALGVAIILFIIQPKKYQNSFLKITFIEIILTKLKFAIGKLFTKSSQRSIFVLGILNGFLPCGLVYTGIAGAVAMGSTFDGMMFMLAFGIGTFPIMFTVAAFGKVVSLSTRKKMTKLVPVFAVLLAIIFIMRGLNLGIPYVSPKISTSEIGIEVECCH